MLIDHFQNLNKNFGPYPDKLRSVLSLENTQTAFKEISTWNGYEPTPLLSLKKIATRTGVKELYYQKIVNNLVKFY